MSTVSKPAQTSADLALRRVALVIPAYNEQDALRTLLPRLAGLGLGQVLVADNGSTDATAEVAAACGAHVVYEPRRGYGAACAAGIAGADASCDVIAFMDADMSDDPQDLPTIVTPLLNGRAELVIGVREQALRSGAGLSIPQRFGTRLALWLIRIGWGYRYRDLGPFRAITRQALRAMNMRDRAFGWTVEMQVRALQMRLRIEQIPVGHRPRAAGKSKISGTLRGVALAGYSILTTIARLYVRPTRGDNA